MKASYKNCKGENKQTHKREDPLRRFPCDANGPQGWVGGENKTNDALIANDAREGPTTSKTVPALFTTSHEVPQKRNRQNCKINRVACTSDETHIPTNSRHRCLVKASQKICTCTCTPKGTLVPKLSIPFPPAAIENSHRQRCSRQAADSTAQNELPIARNRK